MRSFRLRILIGACAGLLLGATAQADITGSIWEVSGAVASDAIPANVPGTTPTVTFDLPGSVIDFQSGGLYTIGEFLSFGGATITSGASHSGDTLDNTLFDITGTVTVTNGETFTAGHDDGLTFTIGSDTVISAPGGTSFTLTTETYTGPSGNLPFQLVYGECCGSPADLEISGLSLTSAPEPKDTALFLFLGLGVVVLVRRKLAGAKA